MTKSIISSYAGYVSLSDERKVPINFSAIHEYCRKNEEEIRVLFDVKEMKWKEEFDPDDKISIMKYINSKLNTVLGINVERVNNKSKKYIISEMFNI